MTFIKIVLSSLLISISLAACNTAEPSVINDPGTTAPVALTSTTEPTSVVRAATSIPASTFTAEPIPAPQEIEPSPTGEKQMPSEPEPTKLLFQAGVENITILGVENLDLQSTIYTPDGSEPLPGVILLHMLGSDRTVWDDTGLAQTLVENGYVVLSVDMRGHGETGNNIDWALVPEDLRRVWKHFTSLETVDPQRTAVLGASIGANLALTTAADQPMIRSAILLSPGLDYRGVSTEGPMEVYGSRPILIVASEEDTYAADSSRSLADLAQGESQLEMYAGAGHGTQMFNAQPGLTVLILNWLAADLS